MPNWLAMACLSCFFISLKKVSILPKVMISVATHRGSPWEVS